MNPHSCNRALSIGTRSFLFSPGLLVRLIVKTSLMACLLFIPNEANADWSPDGVRVTAIGGGDVKIASDGAGGAFIAWTDPRESQVCHGCRYVYRIYLQHLTSTGAIAPGWLANGILISSATASNYSVSDLVPDGFGGALVSWIGADDGGVLGIFATRVLPDGAIAPGWPLAGYKACCTNPTFAYDPRLATDGSGGAFLAWNQQEPQPSFGRDVFMQHITSLGTLAPGWQTDGIPFVQRPGFDSDQHVIPAPGGVFLAWDAPDGGYLQRVTAGGAIANGWPGVGLRVHSGDVFNLNLQTDGHDGAMISGVAYTPTQNVIAARRVSPDAQLDPPGILGSCSGPQFCSRRMLVSTSDRADGFLHAWLVERFDEPGYRELVYLGRTRLGPPASNAPGWPIDGVRVSTAPGYQSSGKFPGIAPDGDGGAFVALDSYVGSITEVWVQHVRADGSIDPGWGPAGKPILPTPGNRWGPTIAELGPGQAIVVWHEGTRGLYAQKLMSDGVPVPTLLSLVDYDVQSGRVTLRWQASDAASLRATVERSSDGISWSSLGVPALEGTDRLFYEDQTALPGRWAYRLRYSDGSIEQLSAVVWVDVPAEAKLSLEGFRPNPSLGVREMAFSLPDSRPASLVVHDVRGRQVFSREVGALGPGAHLLPMAGSEKLGSGVYWISLVRSDNVLRTKGIIMR